ncbi:MAG: type VI secretion system contractile sheath small subunit, partial [Polyangiaceae bacterium]|nr:type VI secretion system contractile sheath small subunit [Polyangiaceae bacterium]
AQGSVTVPGDKVELTEDADANLASDSPTVSFKVTVKDFAQKADRTIPFDSLGSMTPDHIAWSVPEIRRLLTIKFLLRELQANLRNMPELRKALKEALPGMFDSKDARDAKLAPFKDLQTWSAAQYPLLKIKQT